MISKSKEWRVLEDAVRWYYLWPALCARCAPYVIVIKYIAHTDWWEVVTRGRRI